MLAVLALLPLLALASASPVKRYNRARIQSSRNGLCFSIGGITATSAAGADVSLIDCNQADRWQISPGSGSVLYSNRYGTVALDAGPNPGNNGHLTVEVSEPGAPQQTWYLTDDDRIAITGGDQCLDVDENDQLQTYQCTTGNTNQIFYILQDE